MGFVSAYFTPQSTGKATLHMAIDTLYLLLIYRQASPLGVAPTAR